MNKSITFDDKLIIYKKKSELHTHGRVETFSEGIMSAAAQQRYQNIIQALSKGFLKREIEKCFNHPEQLKEIELLKDNHIRVIEDIVSAVTGDVGRAVVGLSVLQCTVKAIEVNQSIRLHKGGRGGKKDFSWEEGISMRTLDNTYITPVLREFNLLKLNKDGFMMTRTLAENYPYSNFYKAQIRGAKDKWLELVSFLEESDEHFAKGCLQYLISKLINNAQNFQKLVDESVAYTGQINNINILFEEVYLMMLRHWSTTSYASRTMEVSMHSFIQSMQDMSLLESDSLLPLSQMRSANKKHKNIGDIEITSDRVIVEAWDAKYGKTYLYDELEELSDKLESHNAQIAGFVCSDTPDMRKDILDKMQDISGQLGVQIEIFSFKEWLFYKLLEFNLTEEETNKLGKMWLIAYTECLSLKRLSRAPIDEPCYVWLESWHGILAEATKNKRIDLDN